MTGAHRPLCGDDSSRWQNVQMAKHPGLGVRCRGGEWAKLAKSPDTHKEVTVNTVVPAVQSLRTVHSTGNALYKLSGIVGYG